MTAPLLGVIADDFTGATDVASMLVRAGMRTLQVIGVPSGPMPPADALVVALKTRTVPADQAVHESLAAWEWLAEGGATRCYFKYCSTFDSTPRGNIGPVTDALMQRLRTDFTIACPAFPENGRTVFRGHLFVGDVLLSDSGMRDHPLTPMTDASLVRVLQAQTSRRVGLVRHDVVAQGPDAVRARRDALHREGITVAVADAVSNADLVTLGEACVDWPLVTAGSGVALGLAQAYARRGWIRSDADAAELPAVGGRAAVVSGSCSQATLGQVQHWLSGGRPGFFVDPLALADGTDVAAQALDWARAELERGPVLVYASATPDAVRAAQARVGVERAGQLVEQALSKIARGLLAQDVRRLVVAGGETSGAVVQSLGVTTLRIGRTIDPGVPWTLAEGRSLLLALKSGNFGGPEFFGKALSMVN